MSDEPLPEKPHGVKIIAAMGEMVLRLHRLELLSKLARAKGQLDTMALAAKETNRGVDV